MFSSAFLSISDGFVKIVENKKIVDYSKFKIIENFDYMSSVDCNQNSKTIFSQYYARENYARDNLGLSVQYTDTDILFLKVLVIFYLLK